MDSFVGCKMVQAERLDKLVRGELAPQLGYRVVYPDGYESWSPKEVFESAYMAMAPNPDLPSKLSISETMVYAFIKEVHTMTLGDKTTVVHVVLRNGFEIVEYASCVDPENYDERLGAEICLRKVSDKIWLLLGFLLQTAVHGIK